MPKQETGMERDEIVAALLAPGDGINGVTR